MKRLSFVKSSCLVPPIVGLLLSYTLWLTPSWGHPDPLENIRIYSYILSVSPGNMYAYLNRGISYRMVSDFKKAIEDFDQAESLGVKGRYLWMNRAMTYVSLKQFDKAIEDINRILETEPDDPASWFYRGEIYYHQKEYQKAIEDYTKSLDLKEAAHVYFVRGDAYSKLGKYDAALEDYTKAVSKRPYTIGFLIARARCLERLGRIDEARRDLDDAARKQPERYQIYYERAVLDASQGLDASKTADIKACLRYIEDELFFRPQDSALFADRAKVYELAGDFEKALSDLNKAVQFAPWQSSKYLRLRADFFVRHGQEQKAKADLDLAEEVDQRPIPTATPLPGPTLSLEEIAAQPTPNLLGGSPR